MRKGRRSAKHHKVRSLQRQEAWQIPLAHLGDAVDDWLAGGPLAGLENAIFVLNAAIEEIGETPGEFETRTPEDEIAIASAQYEASVCIEAGLAKLASSVAGQRQQALARIVTKAVEPKSIPTYAAKFMEVAIAEGGGQADFHPPTRQKARTMLSAIRELKEANGTEPRRYPDPPIRDWSELPREFAGFRLDEGDHGPHLVAPYALPPFADLARYTPDGLTPKLGPTNYDSYLTISEILKEWAHRNQQDLASDQISMWTFLLGYQLGPPDSHIDRISSLFKNRIVHSPWNTEKTAKVTWIET